MLHIWACFGHIPYSTGTSSFCVEKYQNSKVVTKFSVTVCAQILAQFGYFLEMGVWYEYQAPEIATGMTINLG